jgi:membrane-anchored protein YejM (alkaline phosphatase superfamily)
VLWYDVAETGEQQLVALREEQIVGVSTPIEEFRFGAGVYQANRPTEFAHAVHVGEDALVGVWSNTSTVQLAPASAVEGPTPR